MCAISGFLGEYPPGLLTAFNRRMAHRGPDDAGEYYDAGLGIGLAHRRLSIIDLSPSGHQPMWDAAGEVVIAFNGEIYNHRELRVELERDGFPFRSASDTEVILNLYRRDGPALLQKLNGIFAFALWDAKREALLVARDGLGVKPLYYCILQQGFVFASEFKALMEVAELPRQVNERAVISYLTYLYSPSPDTMLKCVSKLLPGHALRITRAGIEKCWCFYRLPYDQQLLDIGPSEAAEETRRYVQQAVKRQMVADVPVGAFLSGGLDSSSVVAFARQQVVGHRLKCFTIGIRGDNLDQEGMEADLGYAKRVARHLDVDLHTVWVGPEMADHFEQMIYQLDEPQADPASLNVLFICRLAREHGIKVLLSGGGGDDIFTGYRRHYALMQERWWSWLPQPCRLALREASRRVPGGTPWGRRIGRAFAFADGIPARRLAGYFSWLHPDLLCSLWGPAMIEAARRMDPLKPLCQALAELPAGTHRLNQMLYLDSHFFLVDHNLNYTDKMSMATGVEVRVPLLDPDLVSFAARLPVRYKQRGATGKWVFKKAMEPLLPHDVIYRSKTGFGAPVRQWLKHELRPLVNDVLSESTLRRRGLFDPEGVSRLLDLDRSGRIDAAYPILALVCVELWLRTFLDRGGAIPEIRSDAGTRIPAPAALSAKE
jgi:asparagine synthase (glutamine-hydrolysing)